MKSVCVSPLIWGSYGGRSLAGLDKSQQLKISSICLSGSGKAECVRAVDVLTVLREKVAFVSGKNKQAKKIEKH